MPPPRRRTRRRPSGGRGGSRRGRPGGSTNRRSFKEFRDRNRPSPSKRTTSTFDIVVESLVLELHQPRPELIRKKV